MKFIQKTTFLLFFFASLGAQAQTEIKVEGTLSDSTTSTSKEEVFTVVDVQPEYPGGKAKMHEFMVKQFNYPTEARNNNIQGRVYVSFIIEKDGSVSNTKVIRGIGYGCDKEAMRIVNAMPNWSPGMQDGEPKRVKFTLPVSFKLAAPTPASESEAPKTKKELKKEKKELKKQEKEQSQN